MAGDFELRVVFLQKVRVSAVGRGGLRVVFLEGLEQLRRDPARLRPFIDGEVPGMLAFFAAVDQPHVHAVPVGVHPEFAGIEEFLLFSAASATMNHTDPVCFFDLLPDRAVFRSGRTPTRYVFAHTFLPKIL